MAADITLLIEKLEKVFRILEHVSCASPQRLHTTVSVRSCFPLDVCLYDVIVCAC